MCYKKTLLISAMIGIFVGLQIRYAPQSKELFGKRPIRGCIEISGCCM